MTQKDYPSVSTENRYKSILLNRPYCPLISTYALDSKRTMSTSSEPVPVIVYINPDKDKELIVDANKGRAGIYR